MDTPIRMPFMERRLDNLHIQKGPMPNGANAFPARSFVYLTGGFLAKCASAATACFGQVPDPSHDDGDLPPVSLHGDMHWVFDPRDAIFVVNITDASGHVGEDDGAPALSEVVIGTTYNLLNPTSGDFTNYQMVNVDSSAQPFFRVIGIYPNQSLTDFNGLVLCRIADSIIQA